MIYCLMGKSASGKDSVFHALLADTALHLTRIVPATTRPKRSGEIDGTDYRFFTEQAFEELQRQSPKRIVECRTYDTVHGKWHYFTLADQSIDPAARDYIYIGTLEAYLGLRAYYGVELVRPIYIYIADDGERLQRALSRERAEAQPKYAEMCRRFLGDEVDFSQEKLGEAGIDETCRFENRTLSETAERIKEWIFG